MAKTTYEKYFCDNCRKELPTCDNTMVISTEKSGSNIGWSRLRVKIEHSHGSHNIGTEDDAELCQACAIALFEEGKIWDSRDQGNS
jgi:hypothetical protein